METDLSIGICRTCEVELVNTEGFVGRTPLFRVILTYCPTCEEIHYTQTLLVSGDMCPPKLH